MPALPVVSVILPCSASHAGILHIALACLRVQQFSWPYEVIVVNSHNSDTVVEVSARFNARVVRGDGSNTAGSARNIGARAANSELLAFIDADCCAEPLWLASLYTPLLNDMIAVGGPVLNQRMFSPVASMDNLMQLVDQAPGRPAGRARELPGSNFAIHKHAFDTTGGFPENISCGEDTLFTQRVSVNWPDQVYFIPSMRIRHPGRTSLNAFLEHQKQQGFSRGRFRLNLTTRQQRLGRTAPGAALAATRRLAYFFYRTMLWNRRFLPQLIMFSPILLLGLTAWAVGFTRGCRLGASGQDESASSSR